MYPRFMRALKKSEREVGWDGVEANKGRGGGVKIILFVRLPILGNDTM